MATETDRDGREEPRGTPVATPSQIESARALNSVRALIREEIAAVLPSLLPTTSQPAPTPVPSGERLPVHVCTRSRWLTGSSHNRWALNSKDNYRYIASRAQGSRESSFGLGALSTQVWNSV